MDPADILNRQIENARRKAVNDETRDYRRQAARAGDPVSRREAREAIAEKKEGDREVDAKIRTIAREEAKAAVGQISIGGDGVEGQAPAWIVSAPKKQDGGTGAVIPNPALQFTKDLTFIDDTGAKAIGTFVMTGFELP